MERTVRSISRSMLSYLKRAREQKEFLLKETKEFERGKRHLANMMGMESEEMTQDDIDQAITYLFPSGLFDKKARPMMKHPNEIFKSQKEAQFDTEGRPNHYLFYTVKPNYYEALHELSAIMRGLNQYEDGQLAKGIINPPDNSSYNLEVRIWLNHDDMNSKFLETLLESEYDYLIKSLNQLISHPYSRRAKSFIESFTKELPILSTSLNLPEVQRDEKSGEVFAEVIAKKREHLLKVKTIFNGTGKIDIEGTNILHLSAPYMRRSVYFPIKIGHMQDKLDIVASFIRKPRIVGQGSVAITLRWAVAQAIAAYSDIETRNRLRLAGLLSTDLRRKERKKFGQEGARRKYTWKKR